jgi:FkbM family methyltransferase
MPERNLIYDVGAHQGEDTRFYLAKGFCVVAIEASPDLCTLLESTFTDHVKNRQLTILNVAVTAVDGDIDFYLDDTLSIWNTANIDWVRRNDRLLNRPHGRLRKLRITGRPLCKIMHEYGVPRYCKIDIEGNDLIALKSLKKLDCSPPDFISIESEKTDGAVF